MASTSTSTTVHLEEITRVETEDEVVIDEAASDIQMGHEVNVEGNQNINDSSRTPLSNSKKGKRGQTAEQRQDERIDNCTKNLEQAMEKIIQQERELDELKRRFTFFGKRNESICESHT